MAVTINGTTGLATDSTSAVVEAVSLNHPSSSTAAITMDASNNVTVSGAFTSQGIDDNATSTAMTLDSSGNLLVGTTDVNPYDNTSGSGIALRSSGAIYNAIDGGTGIVLNRMTSDGTIAQFRKDGTTVGSIGNDGANMYIGKQSGLQFQGNDIVSPNRNGSGADNIIDLGQSSLRFDDIYATNGTIQTSDRNEKQDIEELSEAEKRVATAAKGLIRKFRWIDAVAEKGDDARIHVGVIAQDLKAAFEAEGLDPGRYAMFISSTWWEADETYTDDEGVEQTRTNTYDTAEEAPEGAVERTRLGVRYNQLLAFIIGAL